MRTIAIVLVAALAAPTVARAQPGPPPVPAPAGQAPTEPVPPPGATTPAPAGAAPGDTPAPGPAAAEAAPAGDLPVVQMDNSAGSGVPTTSPVVGSSAAAPPTGSTGGSGPGAGTAAAPSSDWKFEWHGYLRAPLRLGVGKRDNPAANESGTTYHVPIVPDDQYLSWQYTSVQSRAWAEIFLSYGNAWAKGTVGLLGFNFTDSAWSDTDSQFGIAQGWVTLTPDLPYENVRMEAKVGSFWSNYGKAGRYDAGMYDTYLFGRTHVMGETVRGEIDLGKWTLWGEQGFGGKRPDPSVYNNARFTLLHHEHAGVNWDKRLEVGLHYLYAWSQEEERPGAAVVGLGDGSVASMGIDARFDAEIAGLFYLGYAHADADSARTVAPAIEFIHSYGGGEFSLGFVDNYLDGPSRRSNGNGSVETLLGQYSLSMTNLLMNLEKPGSKFWGDGMDLTLQLFGMMNFVSSEDPDADGVTKIKWGGELDWSALPWFGVATRVDRVQPNSEIPEQSFQMLSPRIYFRSKFVTHETIMLQYSRYFYNQRSCDEGAAPTQCAQPPASPALPEGFGTTLTNQDAGNRAAPTARPDVNVFKLQASLWW